MRLNVTWHPLDERWLNATYVAALAGKPVGPETYALASRWSHRRLFKTISDSYKSAALRVMRDEPSFDADLYIWGRPYFILETDPDSVVDALVELETLRDAEDIMQFFFRQMTGTFKRLRPTVDALARAEWFDSDAGISDEAALAEFRLLVHHVEAACVAAEGSGRVKTVAPGARRRRGSGPLQPVYEPPALDGLRSRSGHTAQLIEASELLSYNAAVWSWKNSPCWMQRDLDLTLARLAQRFGDLQELTCAPNDLFFAAHGRFAHVIAAMAQGLDNNYSAGRYVPAQRMSEFIDWWHYHRDEVCIDAGLPDVAYIKMLEAALYARVKNWDLIEASDVIAPFSERLP